MRDVYIGRAGLTGTTEKSKYIRCKKHRKEIYYEKGYLDELALEKGYIVVETGGGKYRDYVHTVDGIQTKISFTQDFVTVCTHDADSDMPGAIMGVQCYIDINCDVVYSTVNLTELF